MRSTLAGRSNNNNNNNDRSNNNHNRNEMTARRSTGYLERRHFSHLPQSTISPPTTYGTVFNGNHDPDTNTNRRCKNLGGGGTHHNKDSHWRHSDSHRTSSRMHTPTFCYNSSSGKTHSENRQQHPSYSRVERDHPPNHHPYPPKHQPSLVRGRDDCRRRSDSLSSGEIGECHPRPSPPFRNPHIRRRSSCGSPPTAAQRQQPEFRSNEKYSSGRASSDDYTNGRYHNKEGERNRTRIHHTIVNHNSMHASLRGRFLPASKSEGIHTNNVLSTDEHSYPTSNPESTAETQHSISASSTPLNIPSVTPDFAEVSATESSYCQASPLPLPPPPPHLSSSSSSFLSTAASSSSAGSVASFGTANRSESPQLLLRNSNNKNHDNIRIPPQIQAAEHFCTEAAATTAAQVSPLVPPPTTPISEHVPVGEPIAADSIEERETTISENLDSTTKVSGEEVIETGAKQGQGLSSGSSSCKRSSDDLDRSRFIHHQDTAETNLPDVKQPDDVVDESVSEKPRVSENSTPLQRNTEVATRELTLMASKSMCKRQRDRHIECDSKAANILVTDTYGEPEPTELKPVVAQGKVPHKTPSDESSPSAVYRNSSLEKVNGSNGGKPKTFYAQLPEGERDLVQVGTRVAVYWRGDDLYFEGIVKKERPHKKKCFFVQYEDGDEEWLSFRKVPFVILSGGKTIITTTTPTAEARAEELLLPAAAEKDEPRQQHVPEPPQQTTKKELADERLPECVLEQLQETVKQATQTPTLGSYCHHDWVNDDDWVLGALKKKSKKSSSSDEGTNGDLEDCPNAAVISATRTPLVPSDSSQGKGDRGHRTMLLETDVAQSIENELAERVHDRHSSTITVVQIDDSEPQRLDHRCKKEITCDKLKSSAKVSKVESEQPNGQEGSHVESEELPDPWCEMTLGSVHVPISEKVRLWPVDDKGVPLPRTVRERTNQTEQATIGKLHGEFSDGNRPKKQKVGKGLDPTHLSGTKNPKDSDKKQAEPEPSFHSRIRPAEGSSDNSSPVRLNQQQRSIGKEILLTEPKQSLQSGKGPAESSCSLAGGSNQDHQLTKVKEIVLSKKEKEPKHSSHSGKRLSESSSSLPVRRNQPQQQPIVKKIVLSKKETDPKQSFHFRKRPAESPSSLPVRRNQPQQQPIVKEIHSSKRETEHKQCLHDGKRSAERSSSIPVRRKQQPIVKEILPLKATRKGDTLLNHETQTATKALPTVKQLCRDNEPTRLKKYRIEQISRDGDPVRLKKRRFEQISRDGGPVRLKKFRIEERTLRAKEESLSSDLQSNSKLVVEPETPTNIGYEENDVAYNSSSESMDEGRRRKEEARTLTPSDVAAILGEDSPCVGASNWVRRSARMPSLAALNAPNTQILLHKLCSNDDDMVVLKMKKYISDPATPSVVMDAVLDALEENRNCESLYIQNYNEGMRDAQVLRLLEILKKPSCKIWCLNIGETYKVRRKTWKKFARGLRDTKITHMYASEHTISHELKEYIRATIRENRTKHTMHIDPNNLETIVRCTHCWWNPINSKALRPYLQAKGYAHILNDKEAQGARGTKSAERELI